MNATGRFILCCLTALGLVFAGCGSDDNGGTTTTTDKGATTTTDEGAAKTDEGAAQTDEGAAQTDEGAAQTDEGAAQTDEGAAPTGACMNAADQALLDTEEKRDAVQATAGTCGKDECLSKPTEEQEQCAVDCIKKDHALSDECAGCYGASVLCGIKNCVAQCIADTAAPACLECLGANCLPAFYTCSGFPPPTE